jgi:hypothetical protein
VQEVGQHLDKARGIDIEHAGRLRNVDLERQPRGVDARAIGVDRVVDEFAKSRRLTLALLQG